MVGARARSRAPNRKPLKNNGNQHNTKTDKTMRNTKNIQWQDKDITVQELTMQELAETLDNIATTADILDLLFDARLPSEAVVKSSGIARANLHKCTPSELKRLWDAAEEVNPFFLAAVRRLTGQPVEKTAKPQPN